LPPSSLETSAAILGKGDEVRRVGDPHTLEGEVAVPYQPQHPGGDLCPSDVKARLQHLFTCRCHGLEAGSSGIEREEAAYVLGCRGSPKDGSREHEIRARLRERALRRVFQTPAADDEVRAERERPRRDRGDKGKGGPRDAASAFPR
jgi:hypothetical protein